jgi:S1/P1 Nuclease
VLAFLCDLCAASANFAVRIFSVSAWRYPAFFLFLLSVSRPSFAWGPEGHEIVGDIARSHLTERARHGISALLGNDDLAAVSVWADDIKAEHPETAGWHFVDIPVRSLGFSEQRDCYRPDERHPSRKEDHHNCVVDRISLFAHVLADKKAPRPDRIEALKFVVHFVGDIHQPLHAIGEARGGNEIHVVEFGQTQCGKYVCNLHFAWDVGLIEHTGRREADYVNNLERWITRQRLQQKAGGTPEIWANESFILAKQVWLSDGGTIDEAYYRNNIGTLDQRLVLAGLRLGRLLNEALGK